MILGKKVLESFSASLLILIGLICFSQLHSSCVKVIACVWHKLLAAASLENLVWANLDFLPSMQLFHLCILNISNVG